MTTPQTSAIGAVSNETKLEMLKLMLHSRINDEMEQALKRRGLGHFQMSAEGHEGLAGVALAMKPNDWLHPHYRDRAIVLGRGVTHDDLFLDFYNKAASSSGGRQMPEHFSSRRHRVVSLSSPVATNLLQAVGMAMSLKERHIPEVVVASIGDASTREGEALEAIAQAAVDKLPLIFLIEDNRYGISTCTSGKTFWTVPNGLSRDEQGVSWFQGCRVDLVDGLDPLGVHQVMSAALERARSGIGSTCVVARVERIKSHSSSDDQRTYRSAEELQAIAAKDPVRHFAERCVAEKVLTQEALDALSASIHAEVEAAAGRAHAAAEPDPHSVIDSAFAPLPPELPLKEQHPPKYLSKRSGGMTMAQCIDSVLNHEMYHNPRISLFGEDIEDPKGDVFGTTRGLSKKYPGRVKNSPLAEATIIGCAVGRALLGDLPVASIQFIDFMGPGMNQLFNEVVTMHWRTLGEWNCPMVIMAPYGAYLPGLGPWHSQTNESIYTHLPGLHVVIPSSPGDAAGLLRFALRCNRPVLFLYPKALLHGAEDTVVEPAAECIIPFGLARTVRPGGDVTVVTWGNCVSLCRAAATQAAQDGIETEIIDLRSIMPWDVKAVLQSVEKTGRLLVVHEDSKTCGFGAEIVSEVTELAFEHLRAVPKRVTKTDDFNGFHYALELAVLPGVDGILKAIREQARQDFRISRKPGTVSAGIGNGVSAAHHAPAVSARVAQGAQAAPPMPPAPAAKPAQPEAAAPVAALAGAVEIKVPRQSPTDEDAVVVRYLVEAGQKVKVGAPLVEMEANKGSFEVEATHEGTVRKLHHKAGDRVRVESASMLTLELAEGALAALSAQHGLLAVPASEVKALPLSPAQIQVGALALKSQLEIPTVSVECEVDVTELVRQREVLKDRFEKALSFRPTYTHMILWSLMRAMMAPQHEGLRGRLSPSADKLLIEKHAHIGFAAVGPNENLYTPVIKNADGMTFAELAKRVHEMTGKVRSGTIHTADLQGATVTLTNIGAFEATSGTPFIIPGQVAMLTAGSILERPRFGKGAGAAAEPRKVLNLKLVFDHRPFNGSHAASFLRTVKHGLETLKLETLLK
jgi:2-oxoisovalerate dehydrogenase E1 component